MFIRGDNYWNKGSKFAKVGHFEKWYKIILMGLCDFILLNAFNTHNTHNLLLTSGDRRGWGYCPVKLLT